MAGAIPCKEVVTILLVRTSPIAMLGCSTKAAKRPATGSRERSVGLLEGRVAIVTGAAAGIGRGIARRYVREGARVIVADIDAENGPEAVRAMRGEIADRATYHRLDVTDADAVGDLYAAVERDFGGVDVVVNTAYVPPVDVLFEQKTRAMLDKVMGVNFIGTWLMMQGALGPMQRRGGGRIINFTSIDAKIGTWLHADYNAAKAAITALTRSVAAEWARFNILVNCIAPAGKGKYFEDMERSTPGFAQAAAAMNPLGRVGDPEEDIGPVAVFLASDMGRYVTGDTINTDGGIHIGGYPSKPQDVAALETGA